MLTFLDWCHRWHVPPQAIAELTSLPLPVGTADTSEARIQSEIRLAAPRVGVTLWRNNTGVAVDKTGRHIRYGLCNESTRINETIKSADLIGMRDRDGRFVAVECKRSDWRYPSGAHEEAQARYIAIVRARGGIAGFCRSVGEFNALVT